MPTTNGILYGLRMRPFLKAWSSATAILQYIRFRCCRYGVTLNLNRKAADGEENITLIQR